VLADHEDDVLSPQAIEAYFALHYWQREGDWDKANVLRCFTMDHGGKSPFLADFSDAARRFRMIDDAQASILVPFGKGETLLMELLSGERPDRGLLRRLQRYTVGVYRGQLETMLTRRVVHEHPAVEGLYLLANRDAYDQELGLCPESTSGADAMII